MQWWALDVYSKAPNVENRTLARLELDPRRFFKEDVMRARTCCLALVAAAVLGLLPWAACSMLGTGAGADTRLLQCQPQLPAHVTGCLLSGNTTKARDLFTCTILGNSRACYRILASLGLLICTSGSWWFYASTMCRFQIVNPALHLNNQAIQEAVRNFAHHWRKYTLLGYLSMALYACYSLVQLLGQAYFAGNVPLSVAVWDAMCGCAACFFSGCIILTGHFAQDLAVPEHHPHQQ